jgi:hypothetical protein
MYARNSLAKTIRAQQKLQLFKWQTQTSILLLKPCGNTDVLLRRLFSKGNFSGGKIDIQTDHPNGRHSGNFPSISSQPKPKNLPPLKKKNSVL